MENGRCFILGAGFSKCCGLPLACELTPMVWRALARNDPMDDSPHPKLVQPGDCGYERVKEEHETIKLLFPSLECDPDRDETWPDFEELITALDELAKYQDAFEEITKRSTENWTRRCKDALLHYLGERFSHLTENAPADGLDTIKTFFGRLDLGRDSIISFNWDVLLEVVAADLGTAVRYGDDQGNGLRVAKPHGSLNLVDSARAEYEEASSTAMNVHSLDVELEYEDGDMRVVLRAQNPKHAWLRQTWARDRLLVEPNIRKVYDNRWIELQWVRALDMARQAERLVVIGFSLPETDLRPRLLLQLSRIQRSHPPQLTIVAPNAVELRDHYRAFAGFDAESFSGTLKDWVDQGC